MYSFLFCYWTLLAAYFCALVNALSLIGYLSQFIILKLLLFDNLYYINYKENVPSTQWNANAGKLPDLGMEE